MGDNHSPGPVDTEDDDLEALLMAEFEENEAAEAEESRPAQPTAKRQKTESRGGVCPPHPGFMGGICIRCGALKPEKAPEELHEPIGTSPSLALKYIHHGLEVSRGEAERLRASTVNHALAQRRLLLILDLDHTLLHSSRFSDVTPAQEEALRGRLAAQSGPPVDRLLHHLPYMSMWTKLRPGIRKFLTDAHDLFDLHVFTMGDKDYAAGMAALLDPDGILFGGRVASSSDAGPSGVKDIDVLLGAEEMVLILDDTVGVWPKHKENLMQIERYIYFPACAVRFGRAGQSLFERGEDESADKGALATSLRVLSEVHRRFFEQYDDRQAKVDAAAKENVLDSLPDARIILRQVRSEILSGQVILFSRIIPKDAKDPSQHPYWQLATHMGAQCVTSEGDAVTHVVAADHTDKTKWARLNGKFVVGTDWLMCCSFTWERADEARFPLGNGGNSSAKAVYTKGPVLQEDEADVKAALAAAGGGTSNAK